MLTKLQASMTRGSFSQKAPIIFYKHGQAERDNYVARFLSDPCRSFSVSVGMACFHGLTFQCLQRRFKTGLMRRKKKSVYLSRAWSELAEQKCLFLMYALQPTHICCPVPSSRALLSRRKIDVYAQVLSLYKCQGSKSPGHQSLNLHIHV